MLVIQLVISWLLIIAVVLPLVKTDYWIFRILEYPRYQKFILCCVAFIVLMITMDISAVFPLVTLMVLGSCVIFLLYKIWPYTKLAGIEMKSIESNKAESQIKLFSMNVYQDNDCYEKLLQQIKQADPDVILLLETDKRWEAAVDKPLSHYKYSLKEPLNNTYGLLFYSRYKMVEGEVKYLVENDVPSVEATLQLPCGQLVKVFGLHPKPPVPGEDDRTTAKDKELMLVAFKAKKEKMPVIVMGDLNDVAWSFVTGLFRKTSGLLDPRRGRGFYSTFSAKSWLFRFPLDYIFCSPGFALISMKRLKYNGSDHFPMFIHIAYKPIMEQVHEKPTADAKEMEEANEKVNQAVA